MFEGDYLDGKKWNIKFYDENGNIEYELKNGKGIINQNMNVNGGSVYFMGDFLCGEINRKGKEYSKKNGFLLFEGKYSNGKEKEYDYDGSIKFEGEYLDNFRIKGKEYLY